MPPVRESKNTSRGPCDCPRPPGVNKDPNNLPDCDCGYSRSDWMPHHDKDCAYQAHGRFHNLQVAAHYVMAELKR